MVKNILIFGGSGYLGRFLVGHFQENPSVCVAYASHSTSQALSFENQAVSHYRVDLETGDGLEDCITVVKPDVVINCAAISSPKACEENPEHAEAINVPTHLISCLKSMDSTPLLIHLSTDQVYGGSLANSSETDPIDARNTYALTKYKGEEYIRQNWDNYVILRSSIIYGPEIPPGASHGVGRPLFVQFVQQCLEKRQPTTFFTDEWRNPVYVGDIVDACAYFAGKTGEGQRQETFNCGGPDRLSRFDMAMTIAERYCGSTAIVSEKEKERIQQCIVPASTKDVTNRGYTSPPDISMVSRKLEQEIGKSMTSFCDGIALL